MDKENKSVHIDETATVPLAYHEVCMTRNHRTVGRLIIAWALSVVLIVGMFVFLWLQYDYVTTTETTGVYVVSDSEGNVIASDLAPEDVIHIMETLSDGNNSADVQP